MGSALGQTQSNVPAPDAFNNQLDCAKNALNADVKSLKDLGLDALLRTMNGMGDPQAIGSAGDLAMVFPQRSANCGSGTVGRTSANFDLAQGYVDVYNAYNVLQLAERRLESAEDTTGVSETTLTRLRGERDDARTAFNAVNNGPIYNLGVAEWDLVPAVNEAVDEWNKAVRGENLGTDDQILGYAAAKTALYNLSDDYTSNVSYTKGTYRYSSAGEDDLASHIVEGTERSTTIRAMKADLEAIDQLIADIKEARDGTKTRDGFIAGTTPYAEVSADLVKAEQERSRILNEIDDAYIASTENSAAFTAYQTAMSRVTVAEAALKGAVENRVNASMAVKSAFQDASDFLDQNVQRLTYLRDKAITDEAADSVVDAVQKKLDAAGELKGQFDAYFGSPSTPAFDAENPAGDLLNALLKAGEDETTARVALADGSGGLIEDADSDGNVYFDDGNGNKIHVSFDDDSDALDFDVTGATNADGYKTGYADGGAVESVTTPAGNEVGTTGNAVGDVSYVTIGDRRIAITVAADDGDTTDDDGLVDVTLSASYVLKADGTALDAAPTGYSRAFTLNADGDLVQTISDDNGVEDDVVTTIATQAQIARIVDPIVFFAAVADDPGTTDVDETMLERSGQVFRVTVPTNVADNPDTDEDESMTTRVATAADFDANVLEATYQTAEVVRTAAEDGGNDGQAIVDAVDQLHRNAVANNEAIGDNAEAIADLTAEDDPDTADVDETGAVTANTNAISALTAEDDPDTADVDETGAVTANTNAISALTAEDDPDTADVDETGVVTSNTNRLDALLATETDADGNEVETGRVKSIENTLSTLSGEITGEGGLVESVDQNERDIAALTEGADTEDTSDDGVVTANTVRSTANAGEIAGLTAGADTEDTSDDGAVTANTVRSTANAGDIGSLQAEVGIDANGDGTVMLPDGNMGSRIDDNAAKLALKAQYIGNIGTELGFDAATGEGTGEGGMSRIDTNEAAIGNLAGEGRTDETVMGNAGAIAQETTDRMTADTALGGRIDDEETARMTADTALGGRIDDEETARMTADTALGGRIDDEETARMAADTMLGDRITANTDAIGAEMEARASADMMLHGMIGAEETARMGADTMLGGRIDANSSSISSNADAIAANMNAIGSNASAISDNRNMIGELSDDLGVVRAGVAASMALAGMPAINGRGISIGVGSFDGESAFAVGFQIQGEMASFKVGVTSGGGATGASAGVGFQF